MASSKPTFCDVPLADAASLTKADVAVFGAPHGSLYQPGTASHAVDAPDTLRSALAWYSHNPQSYDFDAMTNVFGGADVVDCGDAPGGLDDNAANRAAIADMARGILDADTVPILIGGDDSTPIPFIGAYGRRGPLTILQIDAHIDWRDEVDGEHFGFSSTMRRASEMDHVKSIVQIGARGPGSARPQEVTEARDWGATIIPARQLHQQPIAEVIESVPRGPDIYLAIDVDGIDPAVVPGVLLPAFGGVTYTQMLELIFGIAERGRIVGANFVEYVPDKDPTGTGAQAIARLICNVIAAIGKQRHGP